MLLKFKRQISLCACCDFLFSNLRTPPKRANKYFIMKNDTNNCEEAKNALETLKTEFGYVFNKDGQLRKVDILTNEAGDEPFQFDVYDSHAKNQDRYEKIADLIPEVIYDLLQRNDMTRVYLPNNVEKGQATFIFTYPNEFHNPKKLIVLIHGSGFVRAGQWARSLIINNSLDHGTQIPYIERAKQLEYGIVITNTNDNYRVIDGHKKGIPNLSTPSQHARYVWKNVVMACNPDAVAIVAHSYGGTITMELAEEYPKFFKEKVFGIAFTDSAHYQIPKKISGILKDVACNWVASTQPLDTEIGTENSILRKVSAGHPKHEWTSFAAQGSVFQYLEDKYEEFLKAKK